MLSLPYHGSSPSHVFNYYHIFFLSTHFESLLHLSSPLVTSFFFGLKSPGRWVCIAAPPQLCPCTIHSIVLHSPHLLQITVQDGLHLPLVPLQCPQPLSPTQAHVCGLLLPSFRQLLYTASEYRHKLSFLGLKRILPWLYFFFKLPMYFSFFYWEIHQELSFATSRFLSLWDLVQSEWHLNKFSEVSLVLGSHDFHFLSI